MEYSYRMIRKMKKEGDMTSQFHVFLLFAFLIGVMVVCAFVPSCDVRNANAGDGGWGIERETLELERRKTKALESIAEDLGDMKTEVLKIRRCCEKKNR